MNLYSLTKNGVRIRILFLSILLLYISAVINSPATHHHSYTWHDTPGCPAYLFEQMHFADPVYNFIQSVYIESGYRVALAQPMFPDYADVYSKIAPRAPPVL